MAHSQQGGFPLFLPYIFQIINFSLFYKVCFSSSTSSACMAKNKEGCWCCYCHLLTQQYLEHHHFLVLCSKHQSLTLLNFLTEKLQITLDTKFYFTIIATGIQVT